MLQFSAIIDHTAGVETLPEIDDVMKVRAPSSHHQFPVLLSPFP